MIIPFIYFLFPKRRPAVYAAGLPFMAEILTKKANCDNISVNITEVA